ncbi:MAG: esterase-like activity of phytase family protein [Phycisphaerales bacterium]|nr:esterase-like activity of phytase family protein [Phycisphaerales bacterium]
MAHRATTSILLLLLAAPAGLGQPLAVQYRNSVPLATSTTDQTGQSFTVTGMSGITRRAADDYLAVMDNSRYVVALHVNLVDDGSIASAQFTGGVRLADSRDFEGIAYTDAARNSVFLSEEGTPAIHEYSLATGARLRTFTTPPVFASRRSNNGFESLARHPLPVGRGELWTANEEALTVDGPASSASVGTTVRLLHYTFDRTTQKPGAQFAYLTQPWHGTSISGAKGGLSDLLVLPDGRLLALERSFAFSASGFFQTRIYELDFTGATDVSLLPGLAGQTYTTVAKRLLWSGFLTNLEGLTLGPPVPAGGRAMLSIVDDGDPISTNTLHAFVITGDLGPPGLPAPAGNTLLAGPDQPH